MRERELRDGLLRHMGEGPEDRSKGAARVAGEAIRRAKRRVRWLAGVTIFIWTAAAAAIFSAVLFFVTYLSPKLAAIAGEKDPPREVVSEVYRILAYFAVYTAGIIAGLLVLAAIATVAFILVSRQATLRQIGASLAELVEELRAGSGRLPGRPSA
jgi:hypothetical protein